MEHQSAGGLAPKRHDVAHADTVFAERPYTHCITRANEGPHAGAIDHEAGLRTLCQSGLQEFGQARRESARRLYGRRSHERPVRSGTTSPSARKWRVKEGTLSTTRAQVSST